MQKVRKEKSIHKSVLLKETVDSLKLADDAVVVDCTFGGGGHSKEICKRYPNIKIVALDQDKTAWDRAKTNFDGYSVEFVNDNFRNLGKVLEKKGLVGKVDDVVLDLGLSSDQLEQSLRGFSFMKDEKLLMTMKANPSKEDVTAMDVVNDWAEENLAKIIYGYGEERFSRRIAKGIADARKKKKIETTFELVEIIKNAVPASYRRGKTHPATKTFQALRIAVNDELNALRDGLQKGFEVLKTGGRMSVISFHSLEDRIVKNYFKELAKEGKGILINKKPTIAGVDELKQNPRARSAKLRIIEKKI